MMDLINEILATLKHNKLRTALTGFAVSWGIFLLIVLLSAARGVINGFEERMSQRDNDCVESISKHIRRRERRKMPSFWNDMSICPVLVSSRKAFCMALLSAGVPRTENSMHDLGARSSSCSGTRPVRRLIESILSPWHVMAFVTWAMWRAVTCRPSSVII